MRGLSLSWRTMLSFTWGSYQPLPQENLTPQDILHRRGLAPGCPLISTLAITSNLPFITSQSMIGRDVKLQTFLSAGVRSGEPRLQNCSTAAGVGLVGRLADLARFELNLNLPLSSLGTTLAPTPFLSFSLGRDFL